MNNTDNYSIMVHGGAGSFDGLTDEAIATRYLSSIKQILEQGRVILKMGGSALEAVEACAVLLEDDPVFNAGRGSVLNDQGNVEMDAAIMSGVNLAAGAVAGIDSIANPIKLASRVMTDSEHVMFVGEGALRFAEKYNFPLIAQDYFLTTERLAQLEDARRNHKMILDHDNSESNVDDHKHGTIGAIAWDKNGNLAAATSTGGIVNKQPGRVGDSPIIGAGIYADNETCAVSATGYGEDFMRTVLSKTLSDFIYMKNMNAAEATQAGLDYLTRRVQGRGGFILIDKHGCCASGYTTKKMIHGWIEKGNDAIVRC